MYNFMIIRPDYISNLMKQETASAKKNEGKNNFRYDFELIFSEDVIDLDSIVNKTFFNV